MNPPTQQEISQRAESLWRERGCPAGSDLEIWLEAERQTIGSRSADTFVDRTNAETAAESVVEYQITPAGTEQQAIQAAMQKQEARAPQVAHHVGPKSRPHSSTKVRRAD